MFHKGNSREQNKAESAKERKKEGNALSVVTFCSAWRLKCVVHVPGVVPRTTNFLVILLLAAKLKSNHEIWALSFFPGWNEKGILDTCSTFGNNSSSPQQKCLSWNIAVSSMEHWNIFGSSGAANIKGSAKLWRDVSARILWPDFLPSSSLMSKGQKLLQTKRAR